MTREAADGFDATAAAETALSDTARSDGPPARSSPPLLISGATLGRYVIKGVLGAGGMGVVYRAHDPELGRTISDIESDALYIKLKWLARGTGRMWIDNVTLDVVPAR